MQGGPRVDTRAKFGGWVLVESSRLLSGMYWLSGAGSAQAANTSAVLKPLFFQRGPVIWKVGVNVALGLDVADVCCQFGKVH